MCAKKSVTIFALGWILIWALTIPSSGQQETPHQNTDQRRARSFKYHELMGACQVLILDFHVAAKLQAVEQPDGPKMKKWSDLLRTLQASVFDVVHLKWSTMAPEDVEKAVWSTKERALLNAIEVAEGRSKTRGNERDALTRLADAFGARVIIRGMAEPVPNNMKVRIGVWDAQRRKEVATLDYPLDPAIADRAPLVNVLSDVLGQEHPVGPSKDVVNEPQSEAPQVIMLRFDPASGRGATERFNLVVGFCDVLRRNGIRVVGSNQPSSDHLTADEYRAILAEAPGARFVISGKPKQPEEQIVHFVIKIWDAETQKERGVPGGPFSERESFAAARNALEMMCSVGLEIPVR